MTWIHYKPTISKTLKELCLSGAIHHLLPGRGFTVTPYSQGSITTLMMRCTNQSFLQRKTNYTKCTISNYLL